jgi:hypothetical protein
MAGLSKEEEKVKSTVLSIYKAIEEMNAKES